MSFVSIERRGNCNLKVSSLYSYILYIIFFNYCCLGTFLSSLHYIVKN
uniref:Uncharacterized protein n=1 Tax=Siphoviridae sp. ctxMM9 TaxID=2827973 RepID=A0A8S5T6F8_9CAUD|nr:MAG TPA: hypothetical protein [Siphoviridae sp. ctxMM9]